MIRALFALLGALVAGFHGCVHLAVENAALRQQLAVFKQKRPRPSLSAGDRLFWVLLTAEKRRNLTNQPRSQKMAVEREVMSATVLARERTCRGLAWFAGQTAPAG